MRKRRKNSNSKNIIIAGLFAAVLLMTAGYAIYSTKLSIKAIGKIISDWDLRFTAARLFEASSGALEVSAPRISEDGLELDVSVALAYTDDIILYDVDITNFSTMFSAEYTGIEINYAASDPFINWRITGISVGDIIEREEIVTIALAAYWDPAKINRIPSGVTNDLETTHTENATLKLKFTASTESGTITPEKPAPIASTEYSTESWTNESVVASITFDRDVTILNNGGSNEYTFNQNGSFTFEYKYDYIKTAFETVTVDWIDKTAPVIAAIGNPKEDTWTNQNVTITPTVTETDSGFASFLWNLNGGAWTEDFPGTFTSDINGEIGIMAVDQVGNQSAAVYTKIKIDKTAPIIVLNGSSSMTIGLNDQYIDPGAIVNDNFSTGLTAVVTGNVVPSIEGTYSIYYNATDLAGNVAMQARRTVYVTENFNLQRYSAEMDAVQELILGIEATSARRIGSPLTQSTAVSIRGINYYDRWYLVTAADVLAINPAADVGHAPYLVRYEFTPGAAISIAGEVIEGSPIHTFNYTGDPETFSIYTGGLLTAVTQNSTKSGSAWGEAAVGAGKTQTPPTITPGGATYDEYGGLILGDKLGFLAIDQERPVGENFSINATIRGSINQDAETYGATIIAISDTTSKYLAWVRIRSGYLQVITYTTDNKTGLTGNTSGPGFMSKAIPVEYDNNFMNIQITSARAGTTKVYLNGELFSSFASGSAVLTYGNMTIGDLRPDRKLKYTGSVYNFALYSEAVDQDAVTQNWNYVKNELGI